MTIAHSRTSVLPLNLLRGLGTNGGEIPDIIDLTHRLGLTVGRATEHVSIVPATGDIALHLRIAAGTQVIKLDRVTETADGVPIEWCVAFCVRSTGSPALDE